MVDSISTRNTIPRHSLSKSVISERNAPVSNGDAVAIDSKKMEPSVSPTLHLPSMNVTIEKKELANGEVANAQKYYERREGGLADLEALNQRILMEAHARRAQMLSDQITKGKEVNAQDLKTRRDNHNTNSSGETGTPVSVKQVARAYNQHVTEQPNTVNYLT